MNIYGIYVAFHAVGLQMSICKHVARSGDLYAVL